MKFILGVFLSLILNCYGQNSSLVFISHPVSQTVFIGEKVVFECQVQNSQKGNIKWVKDSKVDPDQGKNVIIEHFEDVDTNIITHKLTILKVSAQNEGYFRCYGKGDSEGNRKFKSNKGFLTVESIPEPTRILQGNKLTVKAGQSVTIDCLSEGGRPEPTVAFRFKDSLLSNNPSKTIFTNDTTGRFNATSTLTFLANSEMDGKKIFCESQTLIGGKPHITRDEVKLFVTYDLVVTVERVQIREDKCDKVKVFCDVKPSNLKNLSYKWFLDNMEIDGEKDPELTLDYRTNTSEAVVIKCEVNHKTQIYSNRTIISGQCTPHETNFIYVLAAVGESASLVCPYTSTNRADFQWKNQNKNLLSEILNPRIIDTAVPSGFQSTLIISEVQPADYGTYYCSVTNAHGNRDETRIILLKKPDDGNGMLTDYYVLGAAVGFILLLFVCAIVCWICCKTKKKKAAPVILGNTDYRW